MYLDEIASVIRSEIPPDRLPDGDVDELLLAYAVLARAKGTSVTSSDVHDAWVAWIRKRSPNHAALVAYDELTADVQHEDAVFTDAIRCSAARLNLGAKPGTSFSETLFPQGPPREAPDNAQALDLYKVMVQSSESLVGRRLGVNTFFLTMNGALLTGSGLVIQSSGGKVVAALGIAVLSLVGVILCLAWRSLIVSFGQLNRGKFKVIQAIEQHLKAAIYAAEWEALERGENPAVYRSFTSREIWVPDALLVLHSIALCVALAFYIGWFHFR